MTNQKPRVAILSPGDMGAGVGLALHHNGLDVLTCLAGRSSLTRQRAIEAGFTDLPDMDTLVSQADLIISILVPSEATAIAEMVAAALKRTGAKPYFVEGNAIAPQTVASIEQIIAPTGAGFIDGGIIGGPPTAESTNGRFYVSGPDTAPMEVLSNYGLDVRVVGPKVGQASGLKMLYASSTKGTTALWTELLTAARRLGLSDQLAEEQGRSPVFAWASKSIPSMPHKSRRWIGEMEEIAATFAGIGMTPRILEGAADMYRFIGGTKLADQTPVEPNPTLDEVLDTLAAQLE